MGCPVCELQQRMPSSEFTAWRVFLEREPNQFNKQDYYLAQIAAEIVRPRVKNPERLGLDDYLIRFESRKQDAKPREMTEAEKQEHIERSKAAWAAFLQKGKPPPNASR